MHRLAQRARILSEAATRGTRHLMNGARTATPGAVPVPIELGTMALAWNLKSLFDESEALGRGK